jgi:hypothetical protein
VVLDDGNLWRKEHFCRTIDQAVPGLRGHVSSTLATRCP